MLHTLGLLAIPQSLQPTSLETCQLQWFAHANKSRVTCSLTWAFPKTQNLNPKPPKRHRVLSGGTYVIIHPLDPQVYLFCKTLRLNNPPSPPGFCPGVLPIEARDMASGVALLSAAVKAACQTKAPRRTVAAVAAAVTSMLLHHSGCCPRDGP